MRKNKNMTSWEGQLVNLCSVESVRPPNLFVFIFIIYYKQSRVFVLNPIIKAVDDRAIVAMLGTSISFL